MTVKQDIILKPAKPDGLQEFKIKLQEAFAVSVIEKFGEQNEPIPSDNDIEEAFRAKNSVVLEIFQKNEKVGGVVLTINEKTHHNSLDLLFISPQYHNSGIGQKVWRTIEERYPNTMVWETVTPYFEKRNIHFYVNKCGFKIVEFWNRHNSEPYTPDMGENDFTEEYDEAFRFEKVMR